jgi:glycosyltransferase involved in cell wall biosynthesis
MTAAAPAVSIGIGFLDNVTTLHAALQSIFAQTLQDWELILADDGSRDGSLDLARAVRDPRVRVVSDGVNRGVVYRLNLITTLARAPLICRMDGDDLMHPRRLEVQLAFLEAHPEVDVVGSPVISIDEHGTIRGLRGVSPAALNDPAAALRGAPFAQPTAIGRTRWWAANPYDPRFVRAEDHELWCRTAPHTRFAVVDEPYLFYREPRRVSLRKYVLSCRSDRQIYRQYGPARVGRFATAGLLAASSAKELCYRAACRVGLDDALVGLRSRPPDPGLAARGEVALAQIRRTHVPGIDDPRAVTRAAR